MPPAPKTITILVNTQPVEVAKADLTGLEIKEAAGVPVDFTLYKRHGSHLEEIKNDDTIKVHKNDEFVAVSGQDVS